MSRFMDAPTQEDLTTVKNILRYIVGLIRLGCRHGRSSGVPRLVGYNDKDFDGDVNSHKSTSDTLFFIGSSLVTY